MRQRSAFAVAGAVTARLDAMVQPADRHANPGPVDPAEGVLLARLRQGDAEAFRRLVIEQGPRLLAAARRLLTSEEDARDALQDGFIQAFRALPGFQEQSRLSTWLHRIVINAALMRLRRRRVRAEESIEPLLPMFAEDGHQAAPASAWFSSPDDSAERRLERRETRDLVRAAIARLPVSYRTVVVLRDIEELDTATVAGQLGISENAVKIRLHRARQALRGLLDPHFGAAEQLPQSAGACPHVPVTPS